MPGYGVLAVKSEPLSDDDDNHSAYNQLDARHKIQVKSEPQNGAFHSVPHLLNLQNAEVLEAVSPAAPSATPVLVTRPPGTHEPALLQTLESQPRNSTGVPTMCQALLLRSDDSSEFVPLMPVKDEPLSEGEQQQLSGDETSDSCGAESTGSKPVKSWNQKDMENALEALRTHNMSLTKASSTYGIPSTTLWQRAHRLGIDTPKKEGAAKSWNQQHLRAALQALRSGAISANKASKAYGIPSSTLYKIARREGIRLAAPFNAAPTNWSSAALARALSDIRSGRASVQRASAHYGIPTGTLYGRCKREGIELSRSNPTPWSEGAMGEALEAVRIGQMSINQAAIHYNLPYSSLYGRFKRCKFQPQLLPHMPQQNIPESPEERNHDYTNYTHTHIVPTPEPLTHPYSHHLPIEPDHYRNTSMADNGEMANHVYSEHAMYYNQNSIITS